MSKDAGLVRAQWNAELGAVLYDKAAFCESDGSPLRPRRGPRISKLERMKLRARMAAADRLRAIADALDPDGANW